MAADKFMHQDTRTEESSDDADRGVRPGPLVGAFLALVALVAIGLGVAGVVQRAFEPHDDRESLHRGTTTEHGEPRIESHQATERSALEQRQQRRLTTYGWVDRQQGVVHVPIDVAMDELVRTHAAAEKTRIAEPASRASEEHR